VNPDGQRNRPDDPTRKGWLRRKEIVMDRCKTNFFLMQCSGIMPFFDTNRFFNKEKKKKALWYELRCRVDAIVV
jgi:hypothetical protein